MSSNQSVPAVVDAADAAEQPQQAEVDETTQNATTRRRAATRQTRTRNPMTPTPARTATRTTPRRPRASRAAGNSATTQAGTANRVIQRRPPLRRSARLARQAALSAQPAWLLEHYRQAHPGVPIPGPAVLMRRPRVLRDEDFEGYLFRLPGDLDEDDNATDLASSDEEDNTGGEIGVEASPVNPECPICKQSVLSRRPVSMMCGHVYCRRCIKRSLRNRRECPVCRQYSTQQKAFHNLYLQQ